MIAKREIWRYPEEAKVWVGKYRNSHNLLHWHYDCEFVYVEKGSVDIFCEKKKHSLHQGEALFKFTGGIYVFFDIGKKLFPVTFYALRRKTVACRPVIDEFNAII